MVAAKGILVAVNVSRVKGLSVHLRANSGGTAHMRPDVSFRIRLFLFLRFYHYTSFRSRMTGVNVILERKR